MKEEIKVLSRIALYVLAGAIARGGWMPQGVAESIAADPALIELVTGAVIGIGALAAYWYSNARKALRTWVS